VLWELAVGHVLLFLQVRTFHVLWELAVGHVLLCLTFHVLLELAVGKEFFSYCAFL
jgi:ABC-type spermidine/putrescine transport system permease subunit II